jgi:hypothetical protein
MSSDEPRRWLLRKRESQGHSAAEGRHKRTQSKIPAVIAEFERGLSLQISPAETRLQLDVAVFKKTATAMAEDWNRNPTFSEFPSPSPFSQLATLIYRLVLYASLNSFRRS